MSSAHIGFISPMCLLDTGSGAAVSVKTRLEILSLFNSLISRFQDSR
jgi:hypothetical protein